MNKVKPISPDELVKKKKEEFPNIVIAVVNELIAEKWDGHEAKIYQDTIVDKIIGNSTYTRKEIFNLHLLDFEDLYRERGWDVIYDKPGYCESYEPYFVFKKVIKKDR